MTSGPAISSTFLWAAPHSLLYKYPRVAKPQLYLAMHSHGSSSKVKYWSCIWLFVLSANNTAPIKYNSYALAYLEMVPSLASLGRCEKVCTNQVQHKPLPLITSAGGRSPNMRCTISFLLDSWHLAVQTSRPSMGSRVSKATSSSVMVASPRGRWNVCISWRHLAYNSLPHQNDL